MNPLDDYPKVRKVLYAIFWVIGLVLVVAQLMVAAVEGMKQPAILTAALAAYPAAGAYIGFQAQQNTRERQQN